MYCIRYLSCAIKHNRDRKDGPKVGTMGNSSHTLVEEYTNHTALLDMVVPEEGDQVEALPLAKLGVVFPKDVDPAVIAGGLVIRRESMLTGIIREQYIDGLTADMLIAWTGGQLIQEAMPDIPDHEREFIMTGIIPSEWGDAFPEFDDDWNDCNEGGE